MVNRKETFASDGLLLITALIWGLAFVAQRKGMDFIGPFTYNGIRFALGGTVAFALAHLSLPQREPQFVVSWRVRFSA